MRYPAKCLFMLSILCIGCIPSLNEGYTPETVVYDEMLLGSWEEGKATWIFKLKEIQLSSNTDKKAAYLLTQTDNNGQKAKFDAVMFQLGDQRYLDLCINSIDEKFNELAMFQLIPGHLILKIGEVNETTTFSIMDPSVLKKFIKTHPDEITHKRKGEGIYLTDSTDEVQALLQNADVPSKLFAEPQTLNRISE